MEGLTEADKNCQMVNYSSVLSTCCEENLWPMKIAAQWSSVSAGISFIVAAIVGLLLNAFTIVALSQSEALRNKPGTSFVKNLAFVDVLLCLVVMPVEAAVLFTRHKWFYAHDSSISQDSIPEVLCYVAGLTKYACIAIHGTTLALIGLERYFKIVLGSEVHGRAFSRFYKRLMIACHWILTWTLFAVFGNFNFEGAASGCSSDVYFMHLRPFTSSWVLFTLIVVVVSCSKIVLHARRSSASVATFLNRSFYRKKESPPTSTLSSVSAIPWPDSTSTPHPDCQGSGPDPSLDPLEDARLPEHAAHLEKAKSSSSPMESSSRCALNAAWNSSSRRNVKNVLAKRNFYLVKMLAITTGAYFASATPISILNAWDTCGQAPNTKNVLWSFCSWLPAVNFFIYVGANPVYRQSCLKFARKIGRRISG